MTIKYLDSKRISSSSTDFLTPIQGFDGGQANASAYTSGGGGGSSSVGGNGVAGQAGNGGTGTQSDITGASPTPYYSAGGGGGLWGTGSNAGSGGSSIGGNGSSANNAGGNASGYGSGGGGAGVQSGAGNGVNQTGGNGSAGVVIIRYATADGTANTSGSVTSNTSISGQNILTYTGTGTFTPTSAFDVRYLVIGGGGGGGASKAGNAGGGGAGAGGFRTATGHGVTAKTYNITVGALGAGGVAGTGNGSNGGDSTFDGIISIGGGGGSIGFGTTNYGQDGASGGGASPYATTNFGQAIQQIIPKPSDVQDNSILVEKDTGRRYWFDAPSIDTTGLKAYYKFDEASGNIINQHTTGDGLASADLTTTGVTYGVTGVISTAVSCDGSNDFMVSPSATKTDFNFIHALNQAWSINIWFKKANANDGGITALIANRVGSDVGIRIKNLDRSGSGETRKLQLEIDSGSAGSAVAMYDSNVDSFFPNDTDWHMLTITADNSITTNAMQIYLDGILNHNVNRVGVGDGGTPEYPMNFAQEGDGTDYGDYTFDETSFWTRKLSSTDVTSLYNSGKGKIIY